MTGEGAQVTERGVTEPGLQAGSPPLRLLTSRLGAYRTAGEFQGGRSSHLRELGRGERLWRRDVRRWDRHRLRPDRRHRPVRARAGVRGPGRGRGGDRDRTAVRVRPLIRGGDCAARCRQGLPVAGIAAYEAPFTNDETPPPGADPAARIRELVAAGRERDAVIFWMTDIVHVPEQAAIGLKDAVIGGANSPAWFQRSVAEQAAAVPATRQVTLDGYGHNALPGGVAPLP